MSVDPSSLRTLPVELLRRSPFQPRQTIDPDVLKDLAESIKTQGVVQPIVVRPLPSSAQYEIVAGERRWRAAQLAELDSVPVIVKELTDDQAAMLALVENVQRENLNPIETALAIRQIMERNKFSQQEVAHQLGMRRTQVTHLLRLLGLHCDIQNLLAEGQLSIGHGKVLASLPQDRQRELGARAARHEWSVRRLEREIRSTQSSAASSESGDPNIRRLENRLSETLGAKTSLNYSGSTRRGQLVFSFHSLDELDGILERLGITEPQE